MPVTIKLPDGSEKQYDKPVQIIRVAEDISAGLARVALAAELDHQLCDLTTEIPEGSCSLKILTKHDEQSLEILRHSAAHVLAQAMVMLFGPKVQYTIGPALTDDFQYGFYYDFDLPKPIGSEDLVKIEKTMKEIISAKLPIERAELPVKEARDLFGQLGQSYKVEMIDDLVSESNIETISIYKQGDFVDMCLGPHVGNTSKIKAFKLISTAGAYWRGDEKNKVLTRIYGTAFFDRKELAAHIERIEEAKKRDHRILGKQLGLFLLTDTVGPGLPLWKPKGAIIRRELEDWLRGELTKRGYDAVYTPHIGRLELYKTSGHYPYYEHGLFPTMDFGDGEGYLLKPMNCPHHIQIYKSDPHSYRQLPIRLAEFGQVYRFEKSGELNGLTRVRGFTQDDAHIFCTAEQLEDEIESCVSLTQMVLSTLGLTDYHVRLGLGDDDSSKYVGDPENWRLAEENIRNVVERLGLSYSVERGEAAFYGPKIDFVVTDCIGRPWQLGTIQVDYNLPERFDLEYVGADNTTHRPIMIHRAPLGSPERFIGILIEHYAGAFPLWLAPRQVAVLPVSDKYNEYSQKIVNKLRELQIRVDIDDCSEKIGAKIRKATLDKVPYMVIIGQKELDADNVSVRDRTQGDLGPMPCDTFTEMLLEEIATKGNKTVGS